MNVNFAIQMARRYSESNMLAQVRVTRKGMLDQKSSGDVEATDVGIVYEGVSRVYEVTGPLTMSYGEAPSYYSSTYCSIPIEALGDEVARIHDMVEVLAHLDATVVGRIFRVTHVDSGGQFPVSRRLSLQGVDTIARTPDPQIPADWLVN